MSDHADMRRRAAQHASYGNYWAGKCVGLLDENDRLRTQLRGITQSDPDAELVAEVERLRAAIEEALLHRRWSVLAAVLKGTTDDD